MYLFTLHCIYPIHPGFPSAKHGHILFSLCLQTEKLIKCQLLLLPHQYSRNKVQHQCKRSYHGGCRDKAPCRSPRSGTDLLAFEACTAAPSRRVALDPPLTMTWLWTHQYGLSSTPHCLHPTPKDMEEKERKEKH